MHGGHEITSISKNPASKDNIQILLATKAGMVQLFSIDDNCHLVPIFSIKLENTVPSTVKFADNYEDALVFGFHDGNVCVIHSRRATVYGRTEARSRYTLNGRSATVVASRNIMPGM